MEKLLLLDGNSMLFRAYYATLYSHRMSTSNGIPTNAIFGFVNMLNKAIDIIKPDGIMVAWDADSNTFRKQEYEAYKGTRKPLDEELIAQFPIVREFLDAAGIKRYEIHGYEADDIIGSLAKQNPQLQTTVLTSDRDLLQLIDDSTHVLLMKKGISEMEIMDDAAFQEKYNGLHPLQIIDMKGLMGDASDNIPGVAGVGEKTAIKLLSEYQSVEGVYEHIDSVKGKLKEKLEKDKDKAFLSKHLATIYTEIDFPFEIEDCQFDTYAESVNEFFNKYEMRSLIKKEETKQDVQKWMFETIEHWPSDNELVIPVVSNETMLQQKLYGFMSAKDHTLFYLPLDQAKEDDAFNQCIEKGIITWDAKQMYHLCDRYKLKKPLCLHDLHIAAFLLYSQATDMDALMERLDIHTPETFHDLTKKTKAESANSEARLVSFYQSFTQQIFEKKEEILNQIKEEELEYIYNEIELPLTYILYQMEKEGIDIDESILDTMGEEYDQKIDTLSKEIYEMANKEFNINSPKQLAVVLYDDLGLKSGTKKRTTSADVLAKMQGQHPIIDRLMEYRKYSKIKSTYIEGLKKHIQPDNKIHTQFNQTMTQTGRLSSSEPNLQNISIRDEQGKEIRKAFVAQEGYTLLSADYSQIELRMLAHMADEKNMIEAFNQDEDIHTRTATLIFDVDASQVTPLMRRNAKTVNFGIVYGQTEFGLSEQLGISRLEAREFMNSYFEKFPSIHAYMNQLIDYCKEHGYVKTLFSRRRWIPEINDKNFMTREFGKRAAMNAPIQGSAADLIKLAMIQVDRAMKEKNVKSKLLLQIHDELIFLVPNDELEFMKKLVPDVMNSAMELKVPLKASVEYGRTWYEAK